MLLIMLLISKTTRSKTKAANLKHATAAELRVPPMAAAITDMRLGPLQQQQQQQPQQPPHVRRLGAVGRHLPPRRPGRALAAAESAGAFTEGLAAEVDELFEAYFAEGGGPAPGVSYGVVVGGKLVHTGGHGACDLPTALCVSFCRSHTHSPPSCRTHTLVQHLGSEMCYTQARCGSAKTFRLARTASSASRA